MKRQLLFLGLTFQVESGFLSEIPAGLVGAGTKLGNAASGAFAFRKIAGPVVQTGPGAFRVQLDGQSAGAEGGGASILVEHPGDAHDRRAVQPMTVQFPSAADGGAAARADLSRDREPACGRAVGATSSDLESGLPVLYSVVAGPAEADGNILKLSPIPPRVKYPVKVTVVAWQYGRSTEPKFTTADPVTREFYMTK